MGGMGFRDLRVFNQALLSKQIRRLMTNSKTLVGRVVKARYFKHSSVLVARRGYDPSFACRSLCGSKALLLEGLKWRVGNGEYIRVWEESWLLGERGGRVLNPNIEADPSLCVSAFIDRETGTRKETELRAMLLEEEISLVHEIPLSKNGPYDQLY
ncbi:putative mitochondrial protein AtMg00310 [Silene latifolia]|uniref:putative mitochondrial protein AtMg00310 n=1 Tax=Silene latifolia TaxID=37657 RepID=UPI003D7874BE